MDELKTNVSEVAINLETSTNKEELTNLKKGLLSSPPLLGRRIGISSSPANDLEELGLSNDHHQDIFIEVNRYLLANGAALLYGGDLRANGLTETLMELVGRYRFDNTNQADRMQSFLAYPIYLSLTPEIEAKYIQRIRFHKTPPPDDLGVDERVFTPPDTPSNLYIWARSLTLMREQMEDNSGGRIFIGGIEKGYKGRAPGLLEEFLISARRGIPVFLLGGWGGVTCKIGRHFNGGVELKTLLEEIKVSDSFKTMESEYQKNGLTEAMQWTEELLLILGRGWPVLNNGLSEEENQKLFTSTEIQEVIYYILKGLLSTSKNK